MEGRILRPERAVDFVGRDMQEAELLLLLARQPFVVSPSRAQKRKGPIDVGLEEGFRADDRSIDMAFRREVKDGCRLIRCERLGNQLRVTDIAMDQCVSPAGRRSPNRFAGFPAYVRRSRLTMPHIRSGFVRRGRSRSHPVEYKIRPYKTSTTRLQECSCFRSQGLRSPVKPDRLFGRLIQSVLCVQLEFTPIHCLLDMKRERDSSPL